MLKTKAFVLCLLLALSSTFCPAQSSAKPEGDLLFRANPRGEIVYLFDGLYSARKTKP